MKTLHKNNYLLEGKYDFTYITNDKVIEAKNQIKAKLHDAGFKLPVLVETSFYKSSKIIDFNIFDRKLEVTVEYSGTDFQTRQPLPTRTEVWDLKRAIAEVRTRKNGQALKFLNTLADITIEVNKQARPDIKVRRDNTVFEMLTPEVAEELKQHIKSIKYIIPLVDGDYTDDLESDEYFEAAVENLHKVHEDFFSLPFAADALAAGMIIDRPLFDEKGNQRDTNYNMANSWHAEGKITFDCKIEDLSSEAQAVINSAKVGGTTVIGTAKTIDCYRLANMLIKYFDNDVSLFSDKLSKEVPQRDWKARARSFLDNDLFVDFDEPLEESALINDSMYIIAANGEAGGDIYYMGTSKIDAQKAYQTISKEWRELGLGGGDTPVCLYEYSGPEYIFDFIRADWEAGDDTAYNINIEELGISLSDCKVLASEWGN